MAIVNVAWQMDSETFISNLNLTLFFRENAGTHNLSPNKA